MTPPGEIKISLLVRIMHYITTLFIYLFIALYDISFNTLRLLRNVPFLVCWINTSQCMTSNPNHSTGISLQY